MNAQASSQYDIVVIGAGASGMTAACVAAAEGRRVLLVEKASQVGGTTALSGGMLWIPANHKMAAAGIPDSIEAVKTYLSACVPNAEDEKRLQYFIAHADEAVRYLENKTDVKLRPVLRYPDYYPERPGAVAGARVLEPEPFDASSLGSKFDILAPPLPEFTLFGGMMVSRADIPHFRKFGRSLTSTWRVARLVAQYCRERFSAPRGMTLYLGNALAGRLLSSCIRLGVTIATQTHAEIERDGEGGRWRYRCANEHGETTIDGSCDAVILATGGYSRDRVLREETFPATSGPSSATAKGATGDGVRLGVSLGGKLGKNNVGPAYWVPGSRFKRQDGTDAVFPHTVTDRSKPGIIALDKHGRRFVNEAVSYHEFVLAMLRASNDEEAIAYLICDKYAFWKYGLGRVKPFTFSVKSDLDSGYLVRGRDLAGLARQLNLPVDAVTQTVAEFNRDAERGIDAKFGKGGDIYQRHLGDAEHAPNPCVAPLSTGPYYAIRLHVADLGTATGLDTDENGAVLDGKGSPIAGLYACGNDMNSIMRGTYPGPGITLGPAVAFGYFAARHAAQRRSTAF